ncbi:MAG: NAD(P)H-dependent oxidoreductase [Prevotellaceae bacterium]|jgi:multimeric flavodoxin WrbA/putative sterol carrier protein|nr:NAD(P)H-dependent oxidoreductase [Prevotellaceae bacterium]
MTPKTLKSPYEVMQSMVEILDAQYSAHNQKGTGIIQLYFFHQHQEWICHVKADEHHLEFCTGVADNPTVTLRCSFFRWLDLSSGKLSPIWGALTRKLKFEGQVSFFKTLPKLDFSVNIRDKDDPRTAFEKNATKRWNPPQSVIIINASPRAGNGYTEQFAVRFAEGMRDAGATVEEVHLAALRIKSCTGCWHCWTKEKGCALDGKDDFYALFEKVNQADMVVYALPLYVDGMPAILKSYFDRSVRRVYPYICSDTSKMRHPRRIAKKNQAMVALAICGFGEKMQLAALKKHFGAIAHNFHIPLVATIFRSGAMLLFNNPFAYKQQTEVLENVRKAGAELTLTGKIKRKTKRKIEQKIASKKEFIKMTNYFWFDKIANQKNINDY